MRTAEPSILLRVLAILSCWPCATDPFLLAGARPNAFCRAVELPRILADLGVILTPTLLATLVAAATQLRQQRASGEGREGAAGPASADEALVYANDLVAAVWRLR